MKIYDLVGIGSALLDRFVNCDDKFLADHHIQKGMMALTDSQKMARLGKDLHVEQECAGGAVANSLVGASMLGLKTAFISALGDDSHGQKFIKDLQNQSVLWAGASVEKPTGICLALITQDGQRSMCTSLGASAFLEPSHLNHEMISQAKIIYLESYLWDMPLPQKTALTAAKIAKDSGGLVALNLSDPLCVERHKEPLTDFIKNRVDILIGNQMEICAFYQNDDFAKACEKTAQAGFKAAALTCHEEGAVIFEGNRQSRIKVEKIDKPLDTTGAGDIFAAAFLNSIAQGSDLYEGGVQGARLARQIIQIYGARLPNHNWS